MAILKILTFMLFFVPLLFQIVVGLITIRQPSKLEFWQVCINSILGQIVVFIISFFLMNSIIEQSGTHDGFPIIGVIMVNAIMGGVILITILFQLIFKLQTKKRINKDYYENRI